MKKLTWALMSLMLFLGMGTAFAQVAAPTFSPEGIESMSGGGVASLAVDNGTQVTISCATADAKIYYLIDGEEMLSEDNYATATEYTGVITLSKTTLIQAIAVLTTDGNTEASKVNRINYFVLPSTVETPTFNPAQGAVEAGAELSFSTTTDYEDEQLAQQVMFVYVVDGTDADLNIDAVTFFKLYNEMLEETPLRMYPMGDDYTVEKGVTIKARTVLANMNMYEMGEDDMDEDGMPTDAYIQKSMKIATSAIATAVYTIQGEEPAPAPADKPATPVFNPNGGEITLETEISLSTTTADAQIYYTMDMGKDMPDFSVITTEDELGEATMFMPYDEAFTLEYFGVTEEDLAEGDVVMPLKAAAALIDADGKITWSETATATFTVKGGEPGDGVAQPVISPNDDWAHIGDLVTITCATEGATVYYTLDGSDPADGNNWMRMEYSEPFAISAYSVKDNGEFMVRAAAVADDASATSRTTLMIYAEKPEIEVEESVFGAAVEISSTTYNAKIYYTTDGAEPTEESAEYTYATKIVLTKTMTVKAIAVYPQNTSDVATATFTVAPVEDAVLTLSPVKDDNTVGYNVGTAISINNGTAVSEDWMQRIPAYVYYTTDGTTVPSKEAYVEGGAIKMIAVEWADQDGWYGPVSDNNGNFMALTFTEATHLKAIGYLMEGQEVLVTTALLDQELQIKAEANPTFSLASGLEIKAGDRIVVENPNYYAAFDMEMPEWPEDYFTNEESAAAFDEAMDAYNEAKAAYDEETGALPQTELYYSFDGTKPTTEARYGDNVFATRDGGNIEITIGQDEQGLYAYVAEILGYFSDADTIRIEDGKLSVQVLAVTSEASAEEGGDIPMPYSAKWGRPGGAAPFMYASDFVTANYYTEPVAAPVFSVESGAVRRGTKVEITCATEDALIFYTVDGSEPTEKSLENGAIVINEDMTIKAIAIRGEAKSEVVTATYTIDVTANENEELAGVSVYPNPSNGMFNLELPVAATVEVFMSNGMLYQRLTLSEGNTELTINRSGIYFLRITGEGRTAIKRIIVR